MNTNKPTATLDELLHQLEMNNAGESNAIAEYYLLLDTVIFMISHEAYEDYKPMLEEVVNTLHEVIADEMNHRRKWADLSVKLSGIAPAES